MTVKEETAVAGDATKETKEKPAPPKAAPVKKMFALASPGEWCLLLLGILGAVVSGAVNPAMIYVFGRMIDAVGPNGPSMSEQVRAMLIVGAVGFFASTFQATCLRSFAQMQAAKMRSRYFETLMGKDISWYDVRVTASMAAELNDSCEKMANAFGDKFGGSVQGLSCFFLSMGLGFYMGWNMALVILATVPLMGIGMVVMGQAVQEIAGETQSWYSKAAALVEECLFALRTVVAFGTEWREIGNYETAVKAARNGAVRNYYKTSFGMGFVEFVWAVANGVALFYGMILIYDGTENGSTGKIWTGGDVIIVFFSILTGGFMIGQLEPGSKAFNEGRVGAAKFFDAVADVSVIERGGAAGQGELKTLTAIESFEFKDVHFAYPARPDVWVLKGINLTISRGQKVAFVGESGSGKSTIMALLERFYDPLKGTVQVNGEDIRHFSPSALRWLIGYVGQEPVLFATSVRKNILYGWPSATEADLEEVTELAQLGFVKNLPAKLDTFVGSGGSQFSGGQKQRIAIARAMLRKPKVLFLDEATSALDNTSERMIQETIENIGNIRGESLTTVSIAHRLSTIKKSDVIFALKDGVVAERGNHSSLMEQKGIYYALAASQESAEATGPSVKAEEVQPDLEKSASGQQAQPNEQLAANAMTKDFSDTIVVPKSFKVPYRRLMEFCRPEWLLFVPGTLGALLHGANNPVQAYLLVGILDAFYLPREQMKEEVIGITIQFGILGAITFVATAVHTLCFGIISESITQRLRVAILTAIFRQEVGYHDDPEHTPALMGTALSLWAYRVRNFCGSFEASCNAMSSVLIGLIVAFVGCWQMSLAMLAAVPVLGVASSVQMVVMLGGTSLSNDNIKKAQQIVSDSVQNARTVHATGMEEALVRHHDNLISAANKGFILKSIIGGAAFGLAISAPTFVMTFGFWFSEELVKNGDADFKGVMLAFMGILYAAMGAGQATAMLGDGAKAKQACYSIFELLDRTSKIDGLNPLGTQPTWAKESNAKQEAGTLEFEDVRFAYPFRADVQVLKGVTFKINPGQSVGLVGPSGGGKSTIMALIQRFYDPSSGAVLLGSSRTPLSSVDIRWWRKQVGFVGQEPILFDTTVRENVMYGLDKEAGETISEDRLAECKRMAHLDFLDKETNSGWETQVGPRGGRLSGGQKQRVAICRALVRDPPVLLLDEATSALDTESEKVVQEALENARTGRTSFSIAHRLSTIQDCDVILVTAEGVVVERGTDAELMQRRGVYFKLKASSH